MRTDPRTEDADCAETELWVGVGGGGRRGGVGLGSGDGVSSDLLLPPSPILFSFGWKEPFVTWGDERKVANKFCLTVAFTACVSQRFTPLPLSLVCVCVLSARAKNVIL